LKEILSTSVEVGTTTVPLEVTIEGSRINFTKKVPRSFVACGSKAAVNVAEIVNGVPGEFDPVLIVKTVPPAVYWNVTGIENVCDIVEVQSKPRGTGKGSGNASVNSEYSETKRGFTTLSKAYVKDDELPAVCGEIISVFSAEERIGIIIGSIVTSECANIILELRDCKSDTVKVVAA